MIARKATLLAALAATLLLGAAPGAAQAASPAWRISISSQPTNFVPGSISDVNNGFLPEYVVDVTNVGGAPITGSWTVTVDLPPGITEHGTGLQTVALTNADFDTPGSPVATTGLLRSGQTVPAFLGVDVGDLEEGSTVLTTAAVSGGGAAQDAATQTTTTISSERAPFDFLPGGNGLEFADPDGAPVTQAGSHPYQMNFGFGFPTMQINAAQFGGVMAGSGGDIRDLRIGLPRGVVVDPSATPVRCTEVQLEANAACPDASQVGVVRIDTTPVGSAALNPGQSALFNMVAPPGTAAEFGFDAGNVNIYVHVDGGVRAGDYSLASNATDILARYTNPIAVIGTQLWGDPSGAEHDFMRGQCATGAAGPCTVPRRDIPFLSMPSECRGSLDLRAEADSWADPGNFHATHFEAADSSGNPTGTTGCAALGAGFKPTLKARPTTNVADSPSGLSVDLQIPQTNSLGELATAHLKKAEVTLPEGLVINPSGANGLEACSSAQIGIDPHTGVANGAEPSCPDAAKVGTVQIDSTLVDHPLPGAVYIAAPHDNPFDSLLGIYVVVDDPATGVLVKLAGHVLADPDSGRLTTSFDENPQLPFSEFNLSFKGGAHGVLRTPATCGPYSTTSSLTPWSAPDSGPPATPHDDYSIDQGPGGSCATSPGALPNSPSFDAGTVSPVAKSFSPFVFHLRREDGSQNFSSVTLNPPPGLVAKLAGMAICPDSALAVAATRSGAAEKASPSCPASSQAGNFVAAAGAGPAPYHAPGKIYLTGPYKGAPLSFAFLTPAAAGPYDLGTIVTRAAVYVDSKTGQVRTVADPLPAILQGIPLDVRSIDVSLDRPNFTLNGTSCDPSSVTGSLTSLLGQVTPLNSRFQLAECTQLPFKPKMTMRLKGGTQRGAHPQLTATLEPRPGDADIASVSVALPHSEFLAQEHIRTVCTRVQFAADACPAGAVYGEATVRTPLFDYPLTGHVYLRSSDNPLPDLVPDLRGPAYQPIRIESAGRTDSIHGGIRNSFDFVPDAPFASLVLALGSGTKSLLTNSRDTCKQAYRATVKYTAHNGLTYTEHPKLGTKCKGKKAKHKKRKRR